MDINQFKPNSYVSKQKNNKEDTPHKIRAALSPGDAHVKKKSIIERIISSILSDEIGSVGDNLLTEYVIPGMRDFLADGLEALIRLAFYGKDARKASKNGSYVSYNGYSSGKTKRASISNGYLMDDDLILESDTNYSAYSKAQDVLDVIYEYLETYGEVSIADYYEACGLTSPNGPADQYRGWRDLRGTYISKLPHGKAKINLPRYIDLR